jgi:histidinol-phosphate aminotransferase
MDAMRAALSKGSRYPDAEHEALMDAVAKLHSVTHDQIVLGDGSGENLKLAAAVFTAPGRKLVMASPTFEAMEDYARAAGADTVKVPLNAKYEHDLEKMAAVAEAGLIYICNPNNPTATITPKAAIRAFLKTVPATTTVFVDEAYHHYAESDEYESVIPLVASHPNLVVSRTFSKIYAMAGIRAGYSVSSAEAARRMLTNQVWRSVNVVALSGARASLGDTAFVAEGRRRNTATRRDTVAA